jgi:hypothetical protein
MPPLIYARAQNSRAGPLKYVRLEGAGKKKDAAGAKKNRSVRAAHDAARAKIMRAFCRHDRELSECDESA